MDWLPFLALLQLGKILALLAAALVGYLCTISLLRLPPVTIPAVYASNFSAVLTTENPTYASSIQLGSDLYCTPADLRVCTTAPPTTACCIAALTTAPYQQVSDSAVLLLGLLVPMLLLLVRAFVWRLAVGARFAPSLAAALPAAAAACWVGLDRACADLVLHPRPPHDGRKNAGSVSLLHTADAAGSSSQLTYRGGGSGGGGGGPPSARVGAGGGDEGEDDDNDVLGLPASAAPLGRVLARFGWLLFLWESVACVPVAIIIQGVACLAVKTAVGAPRPMYYALTQWAGLGVGSNRAALGQSAHQSFPSGHSSTAAAGLGCVALVLLDDLRLLAAIRRAHRGTPMGSVAATWLAVGVLTAAMCVVALAVAAWVGVTRVTDHWHFPHDVLAGWLLGVVTAYFCVVVLYPAYGAASWGGAMGRSRARLEAAEWAAAMRGLLVGGGSATETIVHLAVAPGAVATAAANGATREGDAGTLPAMV